MTANTASDLLLTVANIYDRLDSGLSVSAPVQDKYTAEKLRLTILSYKTRAEKYHADLGLTKPVLQMDYNPETQIVTFKFSAKRKARTTATLFAVIPNPDID